MKEALLERNIELVFVCAWCIPPGKEPKLPAGKEYTHEICKTHLKEQLFKQRQRLQREGKIRVDRK